MSQPLTQKEGEAILWMLVEISDEAESYPVCGEATARLLADGYERVLISETCDAMQDMACGDVLPDDLTALEKAILHVSVEHSTWIKEYRTGEATRRSPSLISEAIDALRSLGTKLGKLGVQVNHIPTK